MLRVLGNETLMIGFSLVEDAEPGIATKSVSQVLYPGQRMSVRDGFMIQQTIIYAEAECTVLFSDTDPGAV